jgi:hypothetical protein
VSTGVNRAFNEFEKKKSIEVGNEWILGGWTEMKSKDLLPNAGETSGKR